MSKTTHTFTYKPQKKTYIMLLSITFFFETPFTNPNQLFWIKIGSIFYIGQLKYYQFFSLLHYSNQFVLMNTLYFYNFLQIKFCELLALTWIFFYDLFLSNLFFMWNFADISRWFYFQFLLNNRPLMSKSCGQKASGVEIAKPFIPWETPQSQYTWFKKNMPKLFRLAVCWP